MSAYICMSNLCIMCIHTPTHSRSHDHNSLLFPVLSKGIISHNHITESYFKPFPRIKKKCRPNLSPASILQGIFRVWLLERRHLSLSGLNNCCGSSSFYILLLNVPEYLAPRSHCVLMRQLSVMGLQVASLVHHANPTLITSNSRKHTAPPPGGIPCPLC